MDERDGTAAATPPPPPLPHEARDEVEPKPGPLGFYSAIISILPHIQFEGMDVELRLEAALGGAG